MKISTNDKCTFCNIEIETIEHLLYECQSCQLIWQRLFNLITQQTGLNINLTKTNVILGIPLEGNFPVKQAINTVLDEVMRAPIQLQCIFSYTILANPEVEPHAPNTYQSKLVPSDSINSNKCEGSTSRP